MPNIANISGNLLTDSGVDLSTLQPLLTNPVTGTGTSGQVAYWTGTSSQSGSNNLFWDNANGRLGIGTNAPSYTLHTFGTAGAAGIVSVRDFGFNSLGQIIQRAAIIAHETLFNTGLALSGGSTASQIQAYTTLSLSATSRPLSLQPFGGNLLIGTTTDGGQRLQVTGDVLFKGSGNTSGSTVLTIQNSDGTSLMTMRNDGYSRIVTASGGFIVGRADNTVTVDRSTFSIVRDGVNANISISSNLGTSTSGIVNIVNSPINVAPTSGTAVYNTFHVSPTINQTGGANGITRGLYVNPTLTAAADWRAIESTNGRIVLADTYSASGSLSGSLLDLTQTWDTAGVVTGIRYNVTNTTSSAASLLMDLQVGGSSVFNINATSSQALLSRNGGGVGYRFTDTRAANRIGVLGLDSNGTRVEFSMGAGITSGFAIINAGGWTTLGSTNGSAQSDNEIRINTNGLNTTGFPTALLVGSNFAPTSGTATFTLNQIAPTINQTGGASGITRGILVNPTLTAAADWRSLEWSNNTGWGLYGAGTANNYLNGNLGIGSTGLTNVNLRIERNIEGSTGAYGVLVGSQIRSGVTSQALGYTSSPSIQNTAFTLSQLRHFYAVGISSAGSATITNQSGFYVETTLTGATNNYGFYGDIPVGTGRWNLYMNGTAANYINGNLLLGSTTDNGQKLQVTGGLTVDNTSFTGPALVISKTANSTHRILGGPSENITFGPSNRIFLNTSEVQISNSLFVTTSILNNNANSTGLLINNQALVQNNDTRTGLTLQNRSWRNDGAGGTSTINAVQISPTVDMTLGTTIGTVLLLNPTINTTGGTSTIRGLYYNPTLTSTTGVTNIAIQTVTGDVLLSTTSGNVGVGNTTPFSGATVNSSVELGSFLSNNGNLIVRGYSSLGGLQNNAYGAVGSNYYLDASNALRRKNTDSVSTLEFAVGGFRFSTAGSGAANSVISLTELMRLNSNGNLLLGTTTDAGFKLDVNGTARVSGTELRLDNGTTGVINIYSNTPKINFFSGGGYSIGRTSTSLELISAGNISFYIGANQGYGVTAANGHIWYSANSGSAALARLDTGGSLSIGKGTAAADASSIVELSSSTKGFLPPRMTGTQAEAITTPADGLLVYINNGNGVTITSTGFWGRDAGVWVKLN